MISWIQRPLRSTSVFLHVMCDVTITISNSQISYYYHGIYFVAYTTRKFYYGFTQVLLLRWVLREYIHSCNRARWGSRRITTTTTTTDVLFSEESPLPLADTVVVIAVVGKSQTFTQQTAVGENDWLELRDPNNTSQHHLWKTQIVRIIYIELDISL